MPVSYLDTLLLCAWLTIAVIPALHNSVTSVSAEQLPPSELYERKPCRDNRDCDVIHTFMTCTSSARGEPNLCTCEPYRAGRNNVTKPFYSKENGQCVIRLGEPCTLNPIAGGWGEYKCEPGAHCREDYTIVDPKEYGRCSATGLIVGWLIPTLAALMTAGRILKPY